MHIKAIKDVLTQAMNKYFQFSNNIMFLKTFSYQRIKLYNYIEYVATYVVLSYRNA